jgi:hypothetical protein
MLRYSIVFILLIILNACVTEFIPDIGVFKEFYVVEGLITDLPGRHTIRISKSVPLGTEASFEPVTKCGVWITDDNNYKYQLTEISDGTYVTSDDFCGEVGREYTLNVEIVHFKPPSPARIVDYTLRSFPVRMIPVPEIDSLYYEKTELKQEDGFIFPGEGCNVYINTSDPEGKCEYYRWDYSETWQIENPGFDGVINRVCWITNNSEDINIKSISRLSENRLDHFPIKLISNETDRLRERYRIMVNQYSLSEDEYKYWSDLEKITEQSGNLYDKIPASISGNMYCANDADIQVLGYFSVSAKRSKVLYIDEYFKGVPWPYLHCLQDSLIKKRGDLLPSPEFLNILYYLVEDKWNTEAGFMITTTDRECVDCTVRGSTIKPDFWIDR